MLDEIISRYKGKERSDGLIEYNTVTPAFQSKNFAWQHLDGLSVVVTFASSGFDETILSAVVDRAASIPLTSLQSSITVWPDLENRKNSAMTYLAVIPPSYHHHFANWNRHLSSRTFQVYPAYRTDLGGWESPAVYDKLIHSRTHILSWDRAPRPQIWLKVNSSHGAQQGWFDDEFLLADFPDIQSEVPQLKTVTDSLTVRNVSNQELEVFRNADGVFSLCASRNIVLSSDNILDICKYIEKFTCC